MLAKSPWSAKEDRVLFDVVTLYGPKNWSYIAQFLPERTGKQCRERWHNHVDPNVRKGMWETTEDQLILWGFKIHGPKWSMIARALPGRTDNSIKNRFNGHLKKLIDAGEIDLEAITEPPALPADYSPPQTQPPQPRPADNHAYQNHNQNHSHNGHAVQAIGVPVTMAANHHNHHNHNHQQLHPNPPLNIGGAFDPTSNSDVDESLLSSLIVLHNGAKARAAAAAATATATKGYPLVALPLATAPPPIHNLAEEEAHLPSSQHHQQQRSHHQRLEAFDQQAALMQQQQRRKPSTASSSVMDIASLLGRGKHSFKRDDNDDEDTDNQDDNGDETQDDNADDDDEDQDDDDDGADRANSNHREAASTSTSPYSLARASALFNFQSQHQQPKSDKPGLALPTISDLLSIPTLGTPVISTVVDAQPVALPASHKRRMPDPPAIPPIVTGVPFTAAIPSAREEPPAKRISLAPQHPVSFFNPAPQPQPQPQQYSPTSAGRQPSYAFSLLQNIASSITQAPSTTTITAAGVPIGAIGRHQTTHSNNLHQNHLHHPAFVSAVSAAQTQGISIPLQYSAQSHRPAHPLLTSMFDPRSLRL